ncbi:hypothetical protein [Pedobacter foliorum]|uniref:hypothetical protein n=1 Tax=Pedobacter foliorum TaxID=2739058 RepID=UPI0015639D9D|nr:hypothetical protein [Pedobacter foliorum]NRF38906.1 hypothetical protein [Pedobacter foliorum]
MPSATASLLRLFLPDSTLENFEFKGVIEDSETFHIELEESNNPPSEWDGIKVLSKGFFPQIVIQDLLFRFDSTQSPKY